MNIVGFDKTTSPRMAMNHMLTPSSDYDGMTLITLCTWVTRSRKIAGTLYPEIISEERRQAGFELATFRAWFHEKVPKDSLDSLSKAILILPAGEPISGYGDETNPLVYHLTATYCTNITIPLEKLAQASVSSAGECSRVTSPMAVR